ncbi:hypothetical protein FKM82_024090 [Ascaphus truei]
MPGLYTLGCMRATTLSSQTPTPAPPSTPKPTPTPTPTGKPLSHSVQHSLSFPHSHYLFSLSSLSQSTATETPPSCPQTLVLKAFFLTPAN